MKILKLIFLLLLFNISFLYTENEKGLKINKIKGNEGKRWAICIGINDYNDENIVDLKNAANDAINIGKIFNENGQFDKVITLVDDYKHFENKMLPTKSNIEKQLDYILNFSSPEDLIIFTFSGHGISDDQGNGYLISQDTDINNKFETSIKVQDIVKKFEEYNIKKTLLILDACREEISQTKGIGNKGLLAEKFEGSEVAATFYSTKAGWFSYEDTESEYGVFTRFLIDGLNGNADINNDKVVSFSEIETFVQDSVSNYSLKHNRKQKPYTKIYGEKFGDLALTTYNLKPEGTKSISITENIKSLHDIINFKISLKIEEEYSTALLSWAKAQESSFDEIVILRNKNNSINFQLNNNVNYIEGEKIPNSEIIVLKTLKNSTFSYTDNTLEEGTLYYYKIFTKKTNNGLPIYSKNGIEHSIKTLVNEDTIQVRIDKLKVIKVLEENKSWGVELIWKIEVETSTGERFTISERPREKYIAFVDGKEFSFDNTIEFKLPKKETSYFDIIVNLTDLDTNVKDGWLIENQQDDKVINKKHYRYNYTDNEIYKIHTIKEKEDKSCEVELTWTISKMK
ncbi:MAG: caspase family protein [Fusobacteriaceae bacterium]|nr:caspase family protein [Fusobacteriaceae bacterium]